MSQFGGPGGGQKHFKPTPPQRGSFPLDHYAECKEIMKTYLTCLKRTTGANDECREVAKEYLGCRMTHNLMARDSMRNLGFAEGDGGMGGRGVGGGRVDEEGEEGGWMKSGNGYELA
ncbi:hypothetical protein BT63DRAFT_403060 [Microthyrium microscopicum]|uniref:Cytochrome c oxidase assembly protein COX19 n=1 Tax=Microthyrium microscopicum TaxID=703497 RepID=A0A6A6U6Z9_9PEZI|nr:hypothetical protein BT63DRAFT_403060 [Microthyrium microscopicum]